MTRDDAAEVGGGQTSKDPVSWEEFTLYSEPIAGLGHV